jgi:hypothetical protein
MPVAKVVAASGETFPVGDGRPGEVTRRIADAYLAAARAR